MAQKQEYLSKNQKIVLDIIEKSAQPMKAYSILFNVQKKGLKAPPQVYRALDKLLSIGLVHKIESLNAWTVCCGSHNNKTPVFEICNDCGYVKEHLDQDFTNNINNLSKRTGFIPDNPVLEIHGRCGACANNF